VDKEFNGKTILSPGMTVGFLEQEPRLDETQTVRQIVEQGLQETVDLLNEFNRISERFSQPMSEKEMNQLVERQGEVQEKLDALDAWDIDSRLEMAMDALRTTHCGRLNRSIHADNLTQDNATLHLKIRNEIFLHDNHGTEFLPFHQFPFLP
jgi:ATPase subunit of ABC transporter with duplicated ATPase domains